MKIPAHIIRDRRRREEERQQRREDSARIPIEGPPTQNSPKGRGDKPSSKKQKPEIIVIEL